MHFQKALPPQMRSAMLRQIHGKKEYDADVRCFALTLHYYSPKAYNYVRSVWNNALPAPSTIRKWYQNLDGEAGITKQALEAIQLRSRDSSKPVLVNLVIDEMAIRQQRIFLNDRFYGQVDLGTGLGKEDETASLAKNALVFMAVSLNSNWKVPIAYYFVDGLSGAERANLLTECLRALHDVNAVTCSITFDGAATNLAMCTQLGANFKMGENFAPYFINPASGNKCYVFFDLCHIVKLCRNALGDKGFLLYTENGDTIAWSHISNLQAVQANAGLRLANKVTKKHVNFRKNKMKVNLAMQTLSNSVAVSLEFLATQINDPALRTQFKTAMATAEYCRYVNDMADMLNCKNVFGKGDFCIPINEENFQSLKMKVPDFERYIFSLLDSGKIPILQSQRKTGFLGFIIGMRNMLSLYMDLKPFGLQYLLTYKLSQDYLETFFSAIRGRGGWNNNPNALQFTTAYKRLLVRHEMKEFVNGNCDFDNVEILYAPSTTPQVKKKTFTVQCHEHLDLMFSLSPLVDEIVKYIAGFVAWRVQKKLTCGVCAQQIFGDEMPLLSQMKDCGPYVPPHIDVIKICRTAEKIIRGITNVFAKKKLKEALVQRTFATVGQVFNNKEMDDHIAMEALLKNSFLDCHKVRLVKLIAELYITTRLFHICKISSEKDEYIRCSSNKITLFKGQ